MKDILIMLSDSDESSLRLETALELCERFDSHLTGICSFHQIEYGYYDNLIGASMIDTIREQREAQIENISQSFNKAVATRSAKCTFIAENQGGIQSCLTHASTSDLIVAGQRSPDHSVPADSTFTEDLIMQSGKPVMVIPYIGTQRPPGQTVLVAWDHTREASRAVQDALPILKTAQSVHIVSVVKHDRTNKEIQTADLAEHLARHDINVVAQDIVKNEVPVAETLLSKLSDTGSDMLVMGAYGHSRLREYAFGGVTRTMLDSMTVPVVMSH